MSPDDVAALIALIGAALIAVVVNYLAYTYIALPAGLITTGCTMILIGVILKE